MYRSPTCSHCRSAAAEAECAGCGLWACARCAARGCGRDRTAWTGDCRQCHAPYPDAQRRDVLDDGDGEVLCARCGSRYRLRRLSRLDRTARAALLLAAAEPCPCGASYTADERGALLVLEDRWERDGRTQALYHALCACGRTLASHAGRPA